jgi:hypothetical protein
MAAAFNALMLKHLQMGNTRDDAGDVFVKV